MVTSATHHAADVVGIVALMAVFRALWTADQARPREEGAPGGPGFRAQDDERFPDCRRDPFRRVVLHRRLPPGWSGRPFSPPPTGSKQVRRPRVRSPRPACLTDAVGRPGADAATWAGDRSAIHLAHLRASRRLSCRRPAAGPCPGRPARLAGGDAEFPLVRGDQPRQDPQEVAARHRRPGATRCPGRASRRCPPSRRSPVRARIRGVRRRPPRTGFHGDLPGWPPVQCRDHAPPARPGPRLAGVDDHRQAPPVAGVDGERPGDRRRRAPRRPGSALS